MKIVKRDGKIVNYNPDKIETAIEKANAEVTQEERIEKEKIKEIIEYIESLDKKRMLVEDIQDIIENKLMEYGKYALAKKYIVYRYTRALVRKKDTMDESILGLIKNREELNDENVNKKAILASTQRDLIAGEVSKDLARRILLPPKISKAHEDGEIYFHDTDYFLQSMFDSSYLDLGDMLANTTVINNKLIETPKSFLVACLVATQIIDTIACNQYGGVTIDIKHLAEYLFKTREKAENELKDLSISDTTIYNSLVQERVKNELTLGIQLIQYQLNTLMTTNGQYPNVTLFLNLEEGCKYERELFLIIEEILKQRNQGIKNSNGEYIVPKFPKLVYVLNDFNNLQGGKYDSLTRLAIECAKNGRCLDIISSKIMKKIYKNNVFAPIGNNNFLTLYQENNTYKFEGRFNQGLVTINIPQIAILANNNETKFWSLLDDRLDLAKEALMCKYYLLIGTLTDLSPLHYIHGGVSRFDEGEFIDPLLRDGYSTLSLGFIGINEAAMLIKNEDINSIIGHEFALKVVKRMRNTLEKWKQNTGIGFTLYAGDNKEISSYFTNIDKKRFGKIAGVTDKGYYSSCYMGSDRDLELFSRLANEKDFELYCNGGSYHSVNVRFLNAESNYTKLIRFIYDNMLYTCFDIDTDECKACGYKGKMFQIHKSIYQCPNCGCKDKTKIAVNKKLED